jgi:DNA polymerase III subunit epsilon
VSELLASFPQSSTPRKGNAEEIQRYKSLLDDCVDDGRLTLEEATSLTRQARLTQLTGTQLHQLHQDAWNATFSDEHDTDWSQLTPLRRREMYLLADGLGLSKLAEKVRAVIEAYAEPEPSPESRYLRGSRVGICGNTSVLVQLRTRAEAYGAKVAVRITKTVQWLATTTPDALDPHHIAARTHGVPILEPDRALKRLNEDIRDAELRAFERQRELDEYEARRELRAAEADAYWRPAWRTRELDRDPEYDFY